MTFADFEMTVRWADAILDHIRTYGAEEEHSILRRGEPFHLRDSSHVAIEATCSCLHPVTLILTADEASELGIEVKQ
jgi:hypothetical protein